MNASAKMEWPKISIVTPSYNQGEFIEATLRSVLEQEYPNLEYILMDGGSTDRTPEVLARYRDAFAWCVSQPDGGQSAALNRGFAKSTGEIMAWICADDLLLPGALFSIAKAFRENPNARLVCGKGRKMDVAGQPLSAVYDEDVILSNLHNWCSICTPTMFWKRDLWEEVGGAVDESNHYTMDWELLLRMVRVSAPVMIDDWLVSVRFHEGSKSIQGCVGETDQARKRDREIVEISRRFGGLLCYNSVLFELKKLARFERVFRRGPRFVYALVFRLLHWPIRWLHWLYGRPKSNLMTDFDHSNPA